MAKTLLSGDRLRGPGGLLPRRDGFITTGAADSDIATLLEVSPLFVITFTHHIVRRHSAVVPYKYYWWLELNSFSTKYSFSDKL